MGKGPQPTPKIHFIFILFFCNGVFSGNIVLFFLIQKHGMSFGFFIF